jgi:hypothetical protein
MCLEQTVQVNSTLESPDSVTVVSSLEEIPTIILNLLENFIFCFSITSITNHAVHRKCTTKYIVRIKICFIHVSSDTFASFLAHTQRRVRTTT